MISLFLANKLLNHIFYSTSYTAPSTLGIALLLTLPKCDDTGGTISEPSGGSYARQALNPGSSNWNNPTNGTTGNAVTVTFPTPTGSWGTIVAVGILDSTSTGAGDLLFWAPLDSPTTIGSSSSPPVFQLSQIGVYFGCGC